MASIQEIQGFQYRIENAVNEYLADKEAGCYENGAYLAIFYDTDDLPFWDAAVNEDQSAQDCEFYPIEDYIKDGEPDYDKISVLANEHIFLDH